jgi:opacity protein-like surface antigen
MCNSLPAPYVSVGAGVVIPLKNSHSRANSSSVLFSPTEIGTSLFTLPNVVWRNKYETGFEVFGAVGCSLLPNCRIEGEFLYQDFRRKISGRYDWREVNATTIALFAETHGNPIHHTSARTHVYTLLSNVFFDFQRCNCLTFFFGGGVGVAWIESRRTEHRNILRIVTLNPPLNEASPTLEKSPKLFGTAFAWQVKFGLKYDLIDCFAVAIDYRLYGTTRFQASGSKIITNPGTTSFEVFKIPHKTISGLLNNSVDLSLIYNF